MNDMPSKPPIVFPQEQRLLDALGERVRLARRRRGLASMAVAGRAGISRSTLHKVETGDAGVTIGSYLRVLVALGLEADLNALAADDKVGRKLQDLALLPPPRPRQRNTAHATGVAKDGEGSRGG
jgi:transcriptional regulator with XRE-family HTH domain